MQGILLEVVCNSVILLYKLCFFFIQSFYTIEGSFSFCTSFKDLVIVRKTNQQGEVGIKTELNYVCLCE